MVYIIKVSVCQIISIYRYYTIQNKPTVVVYLHVVHITLMYSWNIDNIIYVTVGERSNGYYTTSRSYSER